ncbi:MAG: hypothetical protein EPO09_03565 [Aquabacterium sp.]|uniref:chemotaxis protein CheD n=1 Tax=Aquabacterium sp. TaxID=1872578 RepID=UPI0012058413|nr:chemotaxis protein CheD [Aquabacterium sp.]TAK97679.1 MAG: hypothetical protein EPO09_03565 [Aquabacterium sp.]
MTQAEPVLVLHPGDVALGGRGDRMQTLLGSCVSIILTDPRRTIGAMCHIVHSTQDTRHRSPSTSDASVALQTMVEMLQSRGLSASLCEAYVYGGGNMFPGLVEGTTVGDHNAQWALEALADMGVNVLSVDVGGNYYRQLHWTVGPDAPKVTAVPTSA